VLPERDHDCWALGVDAAINDDLLASGVRLPDGAVTPAVLGLPDDGIEEVYCAALVRQRAASSGAGYTFCVLQMLLAAFKRRDLYITPSQRWGDPRAWLLTGKV
jgi:hypothetical protein